MAHGSLRFRQVRTQADSARSYVQQWECHARTGAPVDDYIGRIGPTRSQLNRGLPEAWSRAHNHIREFIARVVGRGGDDSKFAGLEVDVGSRSPNSNPVVSMLGITIRCQRRVTRQGDRCPCALLALGLAN